MTLQDTLSTIIDTRKFASVHDIDDEIQFMCICGCYHNIRLANCPECGLFYGGVEKDAVTGLWVDVV